MRTYGRQATIRLRKSEDIWRLMGQVESVVRERVTEWGTGRFDLSVNASHGAGELETVVTVDGTYAPGHGPWVPR